ncbi:ribosome biogenesis GTPase Der [Aliarcobacter butzleri]|uniref:ribosome biogenesis GTPase Der n=1 Tax=Aliarcobacter butzleri TaxID=28197 RepID=UPI0002295B0B|nr:ribosome biogenesis GTPase Der [Aliarcobacter butzleri]MCG3679858.1 ribosome biogenesis GTPase Der [Aliarcobacter butzleri]MCP3648901.1 ribosome biogenesis GTPase Der [Arcobacter sp. DNRA7]MCR1815075.1 ribosome biogenesis GTPase Der [Aliarcobacter butzleri]BAK70822.1 GTP-binding protein [Aliarcobacter butzleri ED-1]
MDNTLKKIALIGQPNVGKSSLFNRIANKRIAIVSDMAGTTRDIRKHEIEILDRVGLLVDTGGIDDTNDAIFSNVKRKAIETAKEADIILFMVDGKNIPDDKDKELFYELQRLGKELALVVNKIDNDKELERLWEFFEFGIGDENLFGISVSHNRGTKLLFEWIYKHLPVNLETVAREEAEALKKQREENFEFDDEEDFSSEGIESLEEEIVEIDESKINVAIIGRVNVGKSSILNAIVGAERSVVSPIAGTTIDPVDESFEYKEKQITFVDTAGLRRRGSIEGIEKFALMRTKEMLERANMALVILDASRELTDLDEKIAGLVDEYGLGTIIVLNKWDENMDTFQKIEEEIRRRFRFLSYAPIIAVSAKTGRSIERLKDKIIEIFDNYTQRIPTSQLNKVIEEAVIRHSLPSPNGAYLRIYYTTQFSTRPPKIALVMNKPNLLHYSYKRYLVNFLRERFNFEGTPIHVIARGKNDKMGDEEYLER